MVHCSFDTTSPRLRMSRKLHVRRPSQAGRSLRFCSLRVVESPRFVCSSLPALRTASLRSSLRGGSAQWSSATEAAAEQSRESESHPSVTALRIGQSHSRAGLGVRGPLHTGCSILPHTTGGKRATNETTQQQRRETSEHTQRRRGERIIDHGHEHRQIAATDQRLAPAEATVATQSRDW